MKGKVVMVTGANAGMGRQVSLELAKLGASVVMVCRNRERGEEAAAEVTSLSGNPGVELMIADLSSQASIRGLVRELGGKHDHLFALVNNVGATLPKRSETVDGFETVFATNHLGTFLLTNLVLPVLKASAPSRVVTVASAAHTMARLNLDDLQSKTGYNEIRVYNHSKLLNVLFSYELARRLEGTGVTANALEPGFVKTNMKVPFPFSLFSLMRTSVEKGAAPTVQAVTSPALEAVNGKFISNKGLVVSSSKASYDEDAARRLWDISVELTHLQPARES